MAFTRFDNLRDLIDSEEGIVKVLNESCCIVFDNEGGIYLLSDSFRGETELKLDGPAFFLFLVTRSPEEAEAYKTGIGLNETINAFVAEIPLITDKKAKGAYQAWRFVAPTWDVLTLQGDKTLMESSGKRELCDDFMKPVVAKISEIEGGFRVTVQDALITKASAEPEGSVTGEPTES